MDSLKHRMEIAADAAWQAGKLTLRYFQTGVAVETKADSTPVTIADRSSEEFLVEFLHREFPQDAFLGEEKGERPGTSGYRWIIDPIDGTKSFVQGVPLYAVLVALEDPSGESVLGVIGFPGLSEIVVAAAGEGCFWNGRRARVSTVDTLADACVVYTGAECFEMTGSDDAYRAIRDRGRVVRGWGDAFGHVLVATGRAEAMLDPVLGLWDIAPLIPIVEEAGGVFSDWKGLRTLHGTSGITTNSALAQEIRSLVPGCEPVPGGTKPGSPKS